MAEGRTLGDPETIHYGLVPRTNRGIFSLNELPDLAERIQVSLLNVLEERDIGIRGYALRLPLDLLLVASANPEDYTNRGRIITPLKDRFGAEIRTHYPLSLADELTLIRQEADIWTAAELPEHLVEVIARFTRGVRESPAVDARSGVSARFAIAAAESAAASAVRRSALAEPAAETPVARVCDLPAMVSTLRGKVEFEVSEEGREEEVLGAHAAPGDRRHVPVPAGQRGPVRPAGQVRGGRHGRVGRAGARHRAAAADRRRPRAGQDHGPAGHGGRRVLRARGRGAGVRPGRAVPDAPAVQGHRRRHQRVRDLGTCVYRHGKRGTAWRNTGTAATSTGRIRWRSRSTCAAPSTRWATSILAGANPADALRELLRRGLGDQAGRRGLDDLLRRVRDRQREIRGSGRLDGILEQARALLDTAIGQERAELFPDPSDEARMREADLDALPADTAQAIRQLADYDWRSPPPARPSSSSRTLLRSEVLDSQFRGMRQAMQNPDPQAMQRVKDMLGDLNQMLAADARGEHTQADFDQFMERYGDMFPDHPQNLEELVDSLVSRMAAAERLLRSLSDEQREELAQLMANALEDAGLAAEMARLADALRSRRPELDRAGMTGGVQMSGDEPLGLGDATTALAELADLGELETALGQDYPGASLDDIDEEAVRRAFGRQAVDDIEALRRIERELERQGYLTRNAGQLELTPKAVRTARATRRCAGSSPT